jgi:stage II sporulation protein D
MKNSCMSERALPSMRISNRLLALLIFTLFTPSLIANAATSVPATFSFQGAGYGHGVGMSQFGARGQALEGKSAIDILRYYYSYVTVEPMVDNQMMRVNIGHTLSTFSIKDVSKLGRIQVFEGNVQDTTTAAPLRNLDVKSTLSFTVLGTLAFPSASSSSGQVDPLPSGKIWTIRWSGTRYLQGGPGVVSVNVAGSNTSYRYGQIQVKLVKAAVLGYRLEVTNTVRLHDEYLWGVGEMPSSWPLAALQAQAIASRTYALNKGATIRTACDCNIYSNSADQAFVGYAKETQRTYGPLWKAAVNSTSTDDSTGLTILFKSAPISAYFSSSSGGITESALNVWGTAVPYAIAVSDPWSLDPKINSRYASWLRPISQSVIASAFGLVDVASLFVNGKDASGRVAFITATSSAGKTVKLTGGAFASKAKLPSAWFDVSSQQVIIPAPSPTPSPALPTQSQTSPAPLG